MACMSASESILFMSIPILPLPLTAAEGGFSHRAVDQHTAGALADDVIEVLHFGLIPHPLRDRLANHAEMLEDGARCLGVAVESHHDRPGKSIPVVLSLLQRLGADLAANLR